MSFESLKVSCGASGLNTARSMSESLEGAPEKLKIIYNQQEKEFTILDSSKVSMFRIQEIISKPKYEGWEPKVQNKTDTNGNKIVRLVSITPKEFKGSGSSSDSDSSSGSDSSDDSD